MNTATLERPATAAPVLADAQAEVQRIETALAEVDSELLGLDLASHLVTLSTALDTAIDSGDADAISKAAQALQAAKTECDAQGTARMVATGRQRALRSALVHARVAVGVAQREAWRERERRLGVALDKAFAEYEALLAPVVEGHLRTVFLANEIWLTRAAIVGTKQVNYVVPQTSFSLPCPNSLPNFPASARPERRLERNVDLSQPTAALAFGIPAKQWAPADRELVEKLRKEIEEV